MQDFLCFWNSDYKNECLFHQYSVMVNLFYLHSNLIHYIKMLKVSGKCNFPMFGLKSLIGVAFVTKLNLNSDWWPIDG